MAEYHDFVTANINHFDKASDTYDSSRATRLDEKVRNGFLSKVACSDGLLCFRQAAFILSDGWSFNAESTTVLSFACGAGTSLLFFRLGSWCYSYTVS